MLYPQNGAVLFQVYILERAFQISMSYGLCVLEETRLKAKDDTEHNEKSQAFIARSKKKIGRFGKFEPHHRNNRSKRDKSAMKATTTCS